MESAQNIFNYWVGGLALVSTILSVLSYCSRYLPTAQLRRLDDLLVETKNIYRKANDEELLPAKFSAYSHKTLAIYEGESDRLREVTYRAKSCLDTLRLLFLGHTLRTMRLVRELSDFRSLLMTMSQNEKAREARGTQTSGVVPSSQMDDASDSSTSSIGNAQGDLGLPSSSCVSESVPQHPSMPLVSTDRRTDDYASPDPPVLPLPSPLNHSRRTSTCSVCSVSEWWAGRSPVPQTSLPTSAAPEEDQCASMLNGNVSSRSSTLVGHDEPPQKSIERRWSLRNKPFSVYFLVVEPAQIKNRTWTTSPFLAEILLQHHPCSYNVFITVHTDLCIQSSLITDTLNFLIVFLDSILYLIIATRCPI